MINYFKDNDNNIVEDDNDEIEEQLKKLEENQQRHIQKLYDRDEIINYKSNNKNSNIINKSNEKLIKNSSNNNINHH